MIIEIDTSEISPKDPNQLSETYVTKNNLTGKRMPVITENTINPSTISRFFDITLKLI